MATEPSICCRAAQHQLIEQCGRMSLAITPFDFPLSVPQLNIAGIGFRTMDPWRPPVDLPNALKRALPKRQAQFIAGRKATTDACRLLGIEPPNLPIGPDRQPVWPPDTVGSISHSENLAVAAIGLQSDCVGVGINVEHFSDCEDAAFLMLDIVSDAEIEMLGAHFGSNQAAILLFSAREAISKAVSPFLSKRIGFRDFICMGGENGRLHFALVDCDAARHRLPAQATVLFAAAADHVCTLCFLPAERGPIAS